MIPGVLDAILMITKGAGFLLALLALYLWANVVGTYSRLKKVLLRWEGSDFGAISVVLFVVMLLLLAGSLLSYAFYIRDAGQVPGAEKWLHEFIGLTGLLVLCGIIYLALKALYIQPVGEEGIYRIVFSKRLFVFQAELLPWTDIYDYYVHQGEFFSEFTFITRRGKYHRIAVPSYIAKTLSRIADYSIEKYAFLMRYGRKTSKSSRQP